jgi:hypothetical protein
VNTAAPWQSARLLLRFGEALLGRCEPLSGASATKTFTGIERGVVIDHSGPLPRFTSMSGACASHDCEEDLPLRQSE